MRSLIMISDDHKEKIRILCIDDDKTSLTLMEKFLTKSGFEVITSDNGPEGLQAVSREKPDLILLDVMMPGMDGYEVCSKLQENEQTAYIPVIFTTALKEDQDKNKAFAVGAVDYIIKPIRKDVLLPKIQLHVETKKQWLSLIEKGEKYLTDFSKFKKFLYKTLALNQKEREKCENIPPDKVYSIANVVGLRNKEFCQYMAEFTGFKYISDIPSKAVRLGVLPAPFCIANKVFPIEEEKGKTVFIVSNPFNWELLETLRKMSKAPDKTSFYVTEPENIDAMFANGRVTKAIQESSPQEKTDEHLTMDDILGSEDDSLGEDKFADEEHTEISDSDSKVVRLANMIIRDAYQQGVSDIHVEPYPGREACEIRFRIDGQCHKYLDVPATYTRGLVSRLKIMSKLDIAEKRKPQDGKILFRLPGQKIELRVATIPTVGNLEDVVMRILASSEPIPLDKMKFSERNLRELKEIIQKPYGIILCVGPTGSGKTTTLHSCLGYINTPARKIWTAEDPVEITQRGLRQVQVQPKIGFTFAAAMRSFLRADPDVIMVGEMRDEETASIGIEASLTGHLVFSTLHTNSAPETITRLLDMGLKPFNFADALLGILAQRLARTLCPHCKEAYVPEEIEYMEMRRLYGENAFDQLGIVLNKDFHLYRPKGCEKCGNTGYKGRIGLHELLIGTDEIKEMIIRKERIDHLRELAISQGMNTLLQDGIQKVIAGYTDFKSVRSVAIK